MSKAGLFNSVAGRLFLFGVAPAVAVIAAIVVWNAVDGYRSLEGSEKDILAASAAGAAAELSARNARWNTVAEVMAGAQSSGMFGRRTETLEFVRRVTESSDLILSSYVVYEPNADGHDAESLQQKEVPPEAMDAQGRFLPVWYHTKGETGPGAIRLKESVGMETLEYYSGPRTAMAQGGAPGVLLTEPYIKEGGLIVSHVHPIVVRGKFAGVAGVNRSLDLLLQIAEEIKSRTQAEVFVLSPGGVFVASTTDGPSKQGAGEALRMRKIESTPFASMGGRWRLVQTGGGVDVFEDTDPDLHETCFYAVEKSAVGGWTVVVRRTRADVMRSAHTALLRNIGIGVAGMLLAGGLLFFASRGLARRVRLAADSADRIAHGDLTQAIPTERSPDETGQLMRSMQAMDGNLNALVGDVKQASIRLNSTATEVAATSKQQEASSATFGAASNQIAAAVKEISSTGRDLVKTMESVNQMAVETAGLAESGRTGLKGMEQVMRDLDGATVSVAEKLNAINERSQKINTIITTITKVADQTNILSINAAIEAEKAGEFGAGFLVIAREIRRLADQTAAATLDIEQMVGQMQGAVSSGVMEMDRFADQVRRGVKEVASAGGQLGEIIERVNRSTASFKQVNESMQAQNEGAEQISDAMGSLVANANQTMQSVHEFSRAAADLQGAISTLRDAVARFKLREG